MGEPRSSASILGGCSVWSMPLTVWRIGCAAVTCDRCGAEASSARRPNGYAALLEAGWTEQPSLVDHDLDGMALEPQRWLGEELLALLCPSCSRRDRSSQ